MSNRSERDPLRSVSPSSSQLEVFHASGEYIQTSENAFASSVEQFTGQAKFVCGCSRGSARCRVFRKRRVKTSGKESGPVQQLQRLASSSTHQRIRVAVRTWIQIASRSLIFFGSPDDISKGRETGDITHVCKKLKGWCIR